jgi:hypothetical protein
MLSREVEGLLKSLSIWHMLFATVLMITFKHIEGTPNVTLSCPVHKRNRKCKF